MTEESIKTFIYTLRNRRYTTGVLHTSPPQWLEDIKTLMACVEFLLNEKQKQPPSDILHEIE